MFSPQKRKTPVQKKNSVALHYFLVSVFVFCGYGLYFWNLFWNLFVIPVEDAYFSFGILCFCFLVVFFCFGFPILSYVFLFWVCSFLFLLLLLSCGFFVSIGHPIYLIVLCI